MSIIEQLERYVTNVTGIDQGILSELTVDARGFHPSERTADRALLGDASGHIEITPSQFGPVEGLRYEVSIPLSARQSTYDVATGTGGDGLVTIHAGQPGLGALRVLRLENGRPGSELAHVLISVPWFVHVETTPAFETAAATLEGWTHRQLLERVRTITHHILRPANVRLVWPDLGETLPPQFDASAPTPIPADGIITGLAEPPATLAGAARQWLSTVSLDVPSTDDQPTTNGYSEALDPEGRLTGRVVATETLAPIDDRTGVLSSVITHLQTVATTDGQVHRERVARWLGVTLARAALGRLGVPTNDDRVTGDIMNDVPDVPLRGLLGLAAPPDRSTDPPTDLVTGYTTRWGLTDRQTALDALLGILIEDRPPDAIGLQMPAGSLPQVERLVPLPPPYGGVRLRPGDQDATASRDAVYAGTPLADPTARPVAGNIGYVRLLQDDLARIGISLVPDRGATGSGRMGGAFDDNGSPTVNTERDTHATLHTEWALREFQLACQYPNVAVDRLQLADWYADNLAAVANPTRAGEQAPVTGVLDGMTAETLRRWRFSRYRYPVVIEAYTEDSNDEYTERLTVNNQRFDNLWHHDALGPETDPRVMARDFSGFADFDPDQVIDPDLSVHTVGYQAGGGPNMTGNHGRIEFAPRNYHATADSVVDLTATERAVFKAIAAFAEDETYNYFDIVNAWDDQVLSHPLCHYVLGLGTHAEKNGEWPGFLAYLHHVDDALYRRYYARNGVWFSRVYGQSQPETNANGEQVIHQKEAYTWRSNATHTGHVILLSRAVPTAATPDGAVTLRKHDTKAARRRYVEWFRGWHWVYRVVRSLRSDVTLRRRTYGFAVRRVTDLLSLEFSTSGGMETGRDIIESELAVALLLRMHVRGSSYGRRLLDAAQSETSEPDRIVAMLEEVASDKRDTAHKALRWNPDRADFLDLYHDVPADQDDTIDSGTNVLDVSEYSFRPSYQSNALTVTTRLSMTTAFPTLAEIQALAPPLPSLPSNTSGVTSPYESVID